MANKALDEKHTKLIRQLLIDVPENKKCMDCGTKVIITVSDQFVCYYNNSFIWIISLSIDYLR